MRQFLTTLSLVLALGCAMALAYSDGTKLNGYSGSPSDGTCAGCHGNLNNGSGSVTIGSSVGDYNVNDTLTFTVTINNTGQVRWGFEATVLDGSDNFVGDILVTDAARTVTNTNGGTEYIHQTDAGTDDGTSNSTSWSFDWVSPATDAGPLTVYVAGLAANSAGGTGGDSTYTDTYVLATLGLSETDPGQRPSTFTLGDNYPNPFNPSTTIEFDLVRRADVRLEIFNTIGQRVRTLHNGSLGAGQYRIEWDGTSDAGVRIGSGMYFYRLSADQFVQSKKMILLK